MSISLTVKYDKTPTELEDKLQAYGLTVTVTNAVSMPSEIFVFQKGVIPGAGDGSVENADRFISIADPLDLEEYPKDIPDLINEIPYFRKSVVSLLFRSYTEMEETITYIKEDIAGLVAALQAAETLSDSEEVVYD